MRSYAGVGAVVASLGLMWVLSNCKPSVDQAALKSEPGSGHAPDQFPFPTPHSAPAGAQVCWYEDDGVNEAVAGCHESATFTGPNCTGTRTLLPDAFGEACQGENTIVETGPGPGWHPHGTDGKLGHPHRRTCPNGGRCVAEQARCTHGGQMIASAKCVPANSPSPGPSPTPGQTPGFQSPGSQPGMQPTNDGSQGNAPTVPSTDNSGFPTDNGSQTFPPFEGE